MRPAEMRVALATVVTVRRAPQAVLPVQVIPLARMALVGPTAVEAEEVTVG